MRLIIIGGSDAGISAALQAREIDPGAEITLFCKDNFPNFSICGLPFFISGEVKDWQALAHRTIEEIEEKGIRLLPGHEVEVIHPADQTLAIKDPDRNSIFLSFDKLVICTGAVSVKPKINGIELPGVFPLRRMDDSFVLKKFLDEKQPASAVVVGGGYIGMEMADAFRYRGMKVTIVEYADNVLPTFDPDFGIKIAENLRTNGVEVRTRVPVSAIEKEGRRLLIKGENGFEIRSDIVLFAVGVRPDVDLALSAGLEIGEHGAIRVNRKMETSMPGIYAAGENAVGGNRKFQGSLGTQVVKIFELIAARTGLRNTEAKIAGFDPLSVDFEGWDHKAYYPGAQKIIVRLTGDRPTGKLLGVQILGSKESEISKRVDIISVALFNSMKVSDIPDIDISYTPPLSSPWDPVQAAAQEWIRKRRNF